MTAQAGIWAVAVAETLGHLGVRYVVDFMRASLKQQRLHDARHVTRYTAARFRICRMPRVPSGTLAKIFVTLHTHRVRIPEFQ